MVFLQGFGDEEESPRQYLEKSELIWVLQQGLDELLKQGSTAGDGSAGPAKFTVDPMVFLAQWLKRNNPAHNEEMRATIEQMRLAESGGPPAAEEKDDLLDGLEAMVADGAGS